MADKPNNWDEKRIEQHLNRAVSRLTPDVWNKLDLSVPQEAAERPSKRERILRLSSRGRGLAAAACLCVALGGSLYYYECGQVVTVISLDVNPSLELSLNRMDRVVKSAALNGDGAAVVAETDVKGKKMADAVDTVITTMADQGYLKKEEAASAVLVTVASKKPESETLRQDVAANVEYSLASNEVAAVVYEQPAAATEEVRQIADQYQISEGKAAFIQALSVENEAVQEEQVSQFAEMSMSEISAEIEENSYSLGTDVQVKTVTEETIRQVKVYQASNDDAPVRERPVRTSVKGEESGPSAPDASESLEGQVEPETVLHEPEELLAEAGSKESLEGSSSSGTDAAVKETAKASKEESKKETSAAAVKETTTAAKIEPETSAAVETTEAVETEPGTSAAVETTEAVETEPETSAAVETTEAVETEPETSAVVETTEAVESVPAEELQPGAGQGETIPAEELQPGTGSEDESASAEETVPAAEGPEISDGESQEDGVPGDETSQEEEGGSEPEKPWEDETEEAAEGSGEAQESQPAGEADGESGEMGTPDDKPAETEEAGEGIGRPEDAGEPGGIENPDETDDNAGDMDKKEPEETEAVGETDGESEGAGDIDNWPAETVPDIGTGTDPGNMDEIPEDMTGEEEAAETEPAKIPEIGPGSDMTGKLPETSAGPGEVQGAEDELDMDDVHDLLESWEIDGEWFWKDEEDYEVLPGPGIVDNTEGKDLEEKMIKKLGPGMEEYLWESKYLDEEDRVAQWLYGPGVSKNGQELTGGTIHASASSGAWGNLASRRQWSQYLCKKAKNNWYAELWKALQSLRETE